MKKFEFKKHMTKIFAAVGVIGLGTLLFRKRKAIKSKVKKTVSKIKKAS